MPKDSNSALWFDIGQLPNSVKEKASFIYNHQSRLLAWSTCIWLSIQDKLVKYGKRFASSDSFENIS